MQLSILILSLTQGPMGYFLVSTWLVIKNVSKCFGMKLISFKKKKSCHTKLYKLSLCSIKSSNCFPKIKSNSKVCILNFKSSYYINHILCFWKSVTLLISKGSKRMNLHTIYIFPCNNLTHPQCWRRKVINLKLKGWNGKD